MGQGGRASVHGSVVCALGMALTLVPGCAGDDTAAAATGDAGPGARGVIGGGDPLPPGCLPTVSPSDDPCVLVEESGVFVSGSQGTPEGKGTRASPLKSIGRGIDLARSLGRRVYACAEEYDEAVTLTEGVAMFGRLDCGGGTWRVTDVRAVIKPKGGSPAVRATGIAASTHLEGFVIAAPDAATPSGSSIAMLAVRSPGLELVDVRFIAGNGGDGGAGVEGAQLIEQPGGTKNGGPGFQPWWCYKVVDSQTVEDPECIVRRDGSFSHGGFNGCFVGTTPSGLTGGEGGRGGAGGRWVYLASGCTPSGGSNNMFPEPSSSEVATGGLPATETPRTAAGGRVGTRTECLPTGNVPAAPGARGKAGDAGKNGLGGGLGTIGENGYTPADGGAGASGAPGQGGGGGGGSIPFHTHTQEGYYVAPASPMNRFYGGTGSGGGAGGCPGLAGTPGKGGGASIGLLAVDSPLRLTRAEFELGRGGAGGTGTFGSEPTSGGRHGDNPGTGLGDGCELGGDGGNGGASGWSGHGAGGPSVGVAHRGGAPIPTGVTMVRPGTGGAGVVEKAHPTNGKRIPTSPPGVTELMYAF